jgi:hypothetical protein
MPLLQPVCTQEKNLKIISLTYKNIQEVQLQGAAEKPDGF